MPPPSSTKTKLKAAKAAIDAQQYSRAIEICNELLANEDQNYHAHVLNGVALSATGEHASAVHAYITATSIRPALPLAHKGIIDAVKPDDPVAEHRLALARAHLALPEPSIETVQLASQLLYKLAKRDRQLVQEALSALERAHAASSEDSDWATTPAWHIVDLVLAGYPENEGRAWEQLDTGVLSVALDFLQERAASSALPVCEDAVYDAMVERLVWRSSFAEHSEQQLRILQTIGAHNALLELAEKDQYIALSDAGKVIQIAFRALHHAPYRRNGRAAAIVSTVLAQRSANRDIAEQLVGLRSVSSLKKGGDVKVVSTTEAIVRAFLHLQREENKIAVQVAQAGQQITEERGDRQRHNAILQLVAAAGLSGERKYKDSLKLYAAARSYAQGEGESWIEAAANRGLVDTSILAHGRKARQTSTIIEEAAGCTDNLYGLLESAWTDALADDVDSETMAELTERAVQRAQREREDAGCNRWEFCTLESMFIMSNSELAAVAKSRLGQMLIQQHGTGRNILERAQRCQMDAASMFKGMPTPFAQLGWIFEQLAKQTDGKKMCARAMRCYERAIAIDPAHPVAGRRLARMLLERNLVEEAAELARQASDFNPRARWAHNVIGWSRVRAHNYKEAGVSFRNAMRGRPKLSAKSEEALFGTDVGRTIEDNDLLVDVDSWRGLSYAYREEGKFGPAVACIDDAVKLLMKPPVLYTVSALFDVSSLQQSVLALLEAEKAMLQQAEKNQGCAIASLESVLSQSHTALAIKTYLSEAHMYAAAKEWLAGCYQRATRIRMKAVGVMEEAVSEICEEQSVLNPTSCFKSLGDICLEVATLHPGTLKKLVPDECIDYSLQTARAAYCKALHYQPWNWKSHGQDIVSAILRQAAAMESSRRAQEGVRFLMGTQPDSCVLAMSFLAHSTLDGSENVARTANHVAVKVSKSTTSKRYRIPLDASIAVHSSTLGEVATGGESAISALRHDPTDWRGWYAVAAVREADAKQNGWPQEMLRSSVDAYKESDRLGAGPVAVQGVVRCATELLRIRREQKADFEDVYADACYCASTASRVGLEAPGLCREVVAEYIEHVQSQATKKVAELSESGSHVDVCKHVHLYPYIPEVIHMTLVPC